MTTTATTTLIGYMKSDLFKFRLAAAAAAAAKELMRLNVSSLQRRVRRVGDGRGGCMEREPHACDRDMAMTLSATTK